MQVMTVVQIFFGVIGGLLILAGALLPLADSLPQRGRRPVEVRGARAADRPSG
jgi:hypothetical protein